MPLEYDISDFLIFCYNFIGKKGERKKIELPRCPFEKIGFFCLEGVKMMILLRLRHFGKKSLNDFFMAPKKKLFSHKIFEIPCTGSNVETIQL